MILPLVFGELPFVFEGRAFTLLADGRTFTSDGMATSGDGAWRDGDVAVRLITGATPDGSRSVVLEADGVEHVTEVCLFDATAMPAPAEIHNHRWYDFAVFQQSTAVFFRGVDAGQPGVFACYANPFGVAEIDGDRVRLWYRPGMDAGGRFRSDPLIIGPFVPEGVEVRREMLPGRDLVVGKMPGYGPRHGPVPAVLDRGEIRAVRNAVEARVPWQPARARVSHWDWGENLFRLVADDPAADAIARYDRMAQFCAEIGIEVVLLSPTMEDADWGVDGPWQRIMWLGMGLDVGRGNWKPGTEPSASLQLLEQVRSRGMQAVAYSNPQILWERNEAWAVPPEEDVGYRWACLAVQTVRDRVIETMRAFRAAYALGGFSLDFVFWAPCHASDHGHDPGDGSIYAQWEGYRRILRARFEDDDSSWVETLIGSQPLLPWGATDMTHPHPVLGDNQPQWVPAWPDLSLDRANGNFQRRTAYWMRNFAFTPSYKIPGQVGHQANRIVAADVERGWDWEGSRFNLLSAVATGPSTLSVCFLPAWDAEEWNGVRARDGEFFAWWIGFVKEHASVLARMEDLFDEPRSGAVDGTIAVGEDGLGFVFLCNPDYSEHRVSVPVGLDDDRLLRELHPSDGRLWSGSVTVEPHSVFVLEVVPAASVARPFVVGLAEASLSDDGALVSAAGRPDAVVDGLVFADDGSAAPLPVPVSVRFDDDGVTPTLGPWLDSSGREVDVGELEGMVTITTSWAPGSALPGLLAELAPPIAPVGDELVQPWSDPSRLRLFPELQDPQGATVSVRIDGDDVAVSQAWMGTFERVKDPEGAKSENNLLGHYVDATDPLLSCAEAGTLDQPWNVELTIGPLWRGQLLGVHVAHLPRRRTTSWSFVS